MWDKWDKWLVNIVHWTILLQCIWYFDLYLVYWTCKPLVMRWSLKASFILWIDDGELFQLTLYLRLIFLIKMSDPAHQIKNHVIRFDVSYIYNDIEVNWRQELGAGDPARDTHGRLAVRRWALGWVHPGSEGGTVSLGSPTSLGLTWDTLNFWWWDTVIELVG